jgi:hypothetical protein
LEIRRDLTLDLEQRINRQQSIVADVDVAPDREQALRDRKVAIAQRPLDHRLVREHGFQLAPERNALKQRARAIEARQAERKRRVHVEMGIDEGRRDQIALGVDGARGLGRDAALDRGNAAVRHGDVEAAAAVRQGGVADDQIEGHAPGAPLLARSAHFIAS